MARALLIVDVQNDFCEGGSLAVAGGAAVAAGVTDWLRHHGGDYSLVVASRDWHDADSDNGGHFSGDPDFVDSWPVHCVAGTPGADFHPDLDTSLVQVEMRKGQGRPSYSAFEGSDPDGRTLAEVLAAAQIDRLEVVGIATDYCVRASALDARLLDLEVVVLTDLIAGVAAESSQLALTELVAAGCRLHESAE